MLATASNPEKAALASKAGADRVVNDRDSDAVDQVRSFAERFERVVEVALGANLKLDLAVAGPETVIVAYASEASEASEASDPTLPVRARMTANATLRFVLLYGVPRPFLIQAAKDITAALAVGVLTELPVQRFSLDEIATAQNAVEASAVGKVLIDIP